MHGPMNVKNVKGLWSMHWIHFGWFIRGDNPGWPV